MALAVRDRPQRKYGILYTYQRRNEVSLRYQLISRSNFRENNMHLKPLLPCVIVVFLLVYSMKSKKLARALYELRKQLYTLDNDRAKEALKLSLAMQSAEQVVLLYTHKDGIDIVQSTKDYDRQVAHYEECKAKFIDFVCNNEIEINDNGNISHI